MMPRSAETLLLTRDLEVVQIASMVIPKHRTDWCQTFSSALTTITKDTKRLIIDDAAGVPMAHLMAVLFLDQEPGRTAILLDAEDAPLRGETDPRVVVLRREFTPRGLVLALEESREATEAATPSRIQPTTERADIAA